MSKIDLKACSSEVLRKIKNTLPYNRDFYFEYFIFLKNNSHLLCLLLTLLLYSSASVASELSEKFLHEIFSNNSFMLKWTTPINVAFVGQAPSDVLQSWRQTLEQVSALAKIEMHYQQEESKANIVVIFTNDFYQSFLEKKTLFINMTHVSDEDYEAYAKKMSSEAISYTFPVPGDKSLSNSITIISLDKVGQGVRWPAIIANAVMREFTGSLGDSNSLAPSSFNLPGRNEGLTDVDIALIKALYHPAISYKERKSFAIPLMAKLIDAFSLRRADQ